MARTTTPAVSVLAALLVLGTGCGEARPGDEVSQGGQAPESVASSPVGGDRNGGLDDASTSEVVRREWDCDLASLMSQVVAVPTGRFGAPDDLTERFDDYWVGTLATRSVEFSPENADPNSALEELKSGEPLTLTLLVSATIGDQLIDYAAAETLDTEREVIALLSRFETDEGESVRLREYLYADRDGSIRFSQGPCSDSFDADILVLSEYLSKPALEVLADWVAADVDVGTGETEYALFLEQARLGQAAIVSEASWESTSPEVRSLRPPDVPASIAGTLDVKAIRLAIDGLDPHSVVILRSPSGVSGIVFADVLPSTEPIYFAAKDPFIEVLIGRDVMDRQPVVIARVDVADLQSGAGVLIDGNLDKPKTALLLDADVIELLGLKDAADLERLRESLLARN